MLVASEVDVDLVQVGLSKRCFLVDGVGLSVDYGLFRGPAGDWPRGPPTRCLTRSSVGYRGHSLRYGGRSGRLSCSRHCQISAGQGVVKGGRDDSQTRYLLGYVVEMMRRGEVIVLVLGEASG